MSNFVTVEALIPECLAIPAAMVGRAHDGDVGGAQTFESHTYTDWQGKRYRYACIRSVVPEYARGMRYLLDAPEMLLGTIQHDTDARFPGADVPTLEQCAAFCAECKVAIGGDADILGGLVCVTPS